MLLERSFSEVEYMVLKLDGDAADPARRPRVPAPPRSRKLLTESAAG